MFWRGRTHPFLLNLRIILFFENLRLHFLADTLMPYSNNAECMRDFRTVSVWKPRNRAISGNVGSSHRWFFRNGHSLTGHINAIPGSNRKIGFLQSMKTAQIKPCGGQQKTGCSGRRKRVCDDASWLMAAVRTCGGDRVTGPVGPDAPVGNGAGPGSKGTGI